MANEPQKANQLTWQKALKAAQRELEPAKLILLLQAAEEAIFLRLQTRETVSTEEREAIDKATHAIRRIQVERLNFPEWESET
jgi:hypothetical protein